MTERKKDTIASILEVCGNIDAPLAFLDRKPMTIEDKDGSFTYASTVAFSDTIFLHPIPQRAFPLLEQKIEEILAHESIHLAIYGLGFNNVSERFDNLFPFTGDWERVIHQLKG